MPLNIVRQDITKMEVDAIVNAANTGLAYGGGVCGAIFRAAGNDEMQRACGELSPINTGQAVITPGFALKAKHVIHTAGPVWGQQSNAQSRALLRRAYESSLLIAKERGLSSIAFPLISSGIFGYPKEEALRIATEAIRDFLETTDMDVYIAIFDREAFRISQELLGEVESYIDEKYVDARLSERRQPQIKLTYSREPDAVCAPHPPSMSVMPDISADDLTYERSAPYYAAMPESIDEVLGELDEPFSTALMRLIDAREMTDVEVYKRANLDRKLFSKIRAGKGYMPSKRTAIALAIALKLTLSETDDLLERAGYALSHSQKFDVIVEYFIVNRKYNIYEINEVLFKYDQPLLGA